MHPNLVVPRGKVKFRENTTSMQLLKHFVYAWERVLIPNGDPVQSSIIYTQTPATIFLWDK
jgi:hypothetical protein